MKKVMYMLLSLILVAGLVANVYSAGTCTTTVKNDVDYGILTFTCTGDATDGSFPATTANLQRSGYVTLVVVDPGTPAPTANYDATLLDDNGVDIMGCTSSAAGCTDGSMINLSTATASQVLPKMGSVYGSRWVQTSLQLNIANNTATAAQTVIKVYMAR